MRLVSLRIPYKRREEIKKIPSAGWSSTEKVWTVPQTGSALQELSKAFPQLQFSREHNCLIGNFLSARHYKNQNTQEVSRYYDGLIQPRTPAWEHQQRAFLFAREMILAGNGCGLFLDMGLGKSKVVIDLLEHWDCSRVLIVCPKKVLSVWQEQFEEHAPTKLQEQLLPLPERFTTTAKADFLRAQTDEPRHDLKTICLANYDSVWRGRLGSLIETIPWDAIILDEAHRVKNTKTAVSEFLSQLALECPKRLALTGTPMHHSPLDVFGIFSVIDPSVFGLSYYRFRNKYCVMGGYNNKEIKGYQNEEDLQQRVFSIGIRFDADEVQDLPEIRNSIRRFRLEESAQLYGHWEHDIQNTFRDRWENLAQDLPQEATGANALTKLIRLQQITSGFCPNEDGDLESVGQEKPAVFRDLLDGLPQHEPVVVFARFHWDLNTIKTICLQLNRKPAEFSGRRNELKAWQDGEANVLVAQIASGSEGASFVRSRFAIFYSLTFSLGNYLQARKRIQRPGQKRSCRFFHLIARGTIDEKIYGAIRKRKDVVQSLLEEYQQC